MPCVNSAVTATSRSSASTTCPSPTCSIPASRSSHRTRSRSGASPPSACSPGSTAMTPRQPARSFPRGSSSAAVASCPHVRKAERMAPAHAAAPARLPSPESPAARMAVIGDALIDELRDPHGSREFVGGAALKVAGGLALLGEQATLVAMVGDDEPGERIRGYLRDYRVGLVESPSPLGTSRAISDRTEGEPRYEFNEAAKRRGIRL